MKLLFQNKIKYLLIKCVNEKSISQSSHVNIGTISR